jgi:hypothetical protein
VLEGSDIESTSEVWSLSVQSDMSRSDPIRRSNVGQRHSAPMRSLCRAREDRSPDQRSDGQHRSCAPNVTQLSITLRTYRHFGERSRWCGGLSRAFAQPVRPTGVRAEDQ